MNEALLDLVASLRPTDALDLLVVWFLVYQTLALLRGSRALRVLGGLIVLVLLYVASRLAGLSTVVLVMERFSFYAVLAIVILFQEDMRRALARVGDPFFGSSRQEENVSTYQKIARACFRLADQGQGALIAVQRDLDLADLADGAVELDAALSEALLVAVFQPASPIHDGAVLIRGDRLWVAGAFLPLTQRLDLPKELGTRHRAAIGQTEVSDALLFLVSEERRAVSIAFRGDLYAVDSPDELRLKVNELLLTDALPSEPQPLGRTGVFPPARTSSGSVPPVSGEESP